MKKLTQQQYLLKAFATHGNKYNYDKAVYINKRTKIIITCKKHGDFKQTPDAHINQKQGCSKCALDDRSKMQKGILKKSQHDHIQDFAILHDDTYDYSLVSMTTIHSKINIICRKHGSFSQLAHAHKAGQGCPKCAVRKSYKCNNNVIYLLSGVFNEIKIYKIGVTSKRRGNIRFTQIKRESGISDMKMIVKKDVVDALKLEAEILSLGSRVYGLKKFGGYTEFRYYSDTELSQIRNILT